MYPERTIFHLLSRHGVPFVIIGGHAVHYYGFERMTENADVVWFRSPDSEKSLLAALQEAEACRIGSEIDPATGIEKLIPITAGHIEITHLMMLWTKFGFLDLFDYIPGYPLEEPTQLLDGSVEVDGLRFVSKDWLQKMKEKAARTKDLQEQGC